MLFLKKNEEGQTCSGTKYIIVKVYHEHVFDKKIINLMKKYINSAQIKFQATSTSRATSFNKKKTTFIF